MIAEVIVDITAGETDRVFDYLCDDGITVGARVLAPFGPRMLTGFVMRLKEATDFDPARLKKIRPADDGLPALTEECVDLAQKLAKRYAVPLALSLRLFLPAEMRTGKVKELLRRYAVLAVSPEDMAFPKSAKLRTS